VSVACYPVTVPVRTTEPTPQQEPVSAAVAIARLNLGDVGAYHEPELWPMIAAARRKVEHDALLVCYTGTFTCRYTTFPYRDWFELPSNLRPVTAISSITYTGPTGTTDTFSAASYGLWTGALRPSVKLTYNESWPTVRGDLNGITVSVTAGYASVLAIPDDVKTAVLLALQMDWQLKMEQPDLAMKTQQAYENYIERLRPGTYS
jgi:uncharacterized phiE125 gp8 family phage protein